MEFNTVCSVNSSIRIFLRFEFDESILALHDNVGHFAVLPVQILQMLLIDVVADVPDVYLDGFLFSLLIEALAASRTLGVVASLTLPSLIIVLLLVLRVVRLLFPTWRVTVLPILRILNLAVEFVTLEVSWVVRGLLVVHYGLLIVS